MCSLGEGSPLRSLSSRSRSWLQRPLTSRLYRIRAAIVEEFALADEEWDCQLVSTSTVAVRTGVARIGHRATRDVRGTREKQALREALKFQSLWGRRRLKLVLFSWVHPGDTMLVIPRGPEHQDLVAHPSLAGNGVLEVRVR